MTDLGYKNNNSILNLGSLFLFVVLYILKILLVYPIFLLAAKLTGKGNRLLKSMQKQMFYGEIILLMIEGCMEFLISGYLNAIDPLFDSTFVGNKISLYVGYFSLFLIMVLMPAIFFYVLTQPLYFIRHSPEFQQKWGMIYDGCKTKSKATMSFFLVFLIRRLLYLYVAFAFTEHTIFIALSLLYINLFVTIYQGQFFPKITKFLNYIEVFNEFSVEVTFVHMLLFTEWIPDPNVQYLIGYSMITVISLNIFVNLVIVFYICGKSVSLINVKYYRVIRHRSQILKAKFRRFFDH